MPKALWIRELIVSKIAFSERSRGGQGWKIGSPISGSWKGPNPEEAQEGRSIGCLVCCCVYSRRSGHKSWPDVPGVSVRDESVAGGWHHLGGRHQMLRKERKSELGLRYRPVVLDTWKVEAGGT